METKLPKPKRLTLRRKSDGATQFSRGNARTFVCSCGNRTFYKDGLCSDCYRKRYGATQFPRAVTEKNAAQVAAEAKLAKSIVLQCMADTPPDHPDYEAIQARVARNTSAEPVTSEEISDDAIFQRANKAACLLDVWDITKGILELADSATGLYRRLVAKSVAAIHAGATESEVRDTIIRAGWTASRASEVLKIASLPEPDLRQYLEEGMSWRLALSTARLSPLLRDTLNVAHAGLFADDLPHDPALLPLGATWPAPMLADLPHPVSVPDERPVVVADGDAPGGESSPPLPFGEGASDPAAPAHVGAPSAPAPARAKRGPAKSADVRILAMLAGVAKLVRKGHPYGAHIERPPQVHEIGGYRFTIEQLSK